MHGIATNGPAPVTSRGGAGESVGGRFEFRVWGKHRRARARLAELADSQTRERIDDCYLLVDDSGWNAKVRDNTLKLKQLISERKGFEQWTRDKHRRADTAPSPFDTVFDELALERAQRGKTYDLADALAGLDPALGVRPVFVVKDRRRYRIDTMAAEATKITITEPGEVLHTLSIEGDDLDELRRLRKTLGRRHETNTPVHHALDEHHRGSTSGAD